MNQLPVLIPTALIFTALVALLAGMRSPRAAHVTTLIGASVAFLLAMAGLVIVVTGDAPLRYELGGWAPPVGIELVLDHLAAYITTLATFIGVVVLVYAPRSLAAEAPGKESLAYPAIAMLLAGLCGMCLTGDIFNLYVFLEIASLAAYGLLAIGGRAAPFATFRYLLIGALGGGFYLIGVAFLYFSSGTLNMADLNSALPAIAGSRTVAAAATFMVVGLGVKMALFPMHFWLPDVYTNAPSAVAGLIAPLMTKVSAYAIIRLLLDVFPASLLGPDLLIVPAVGWLAAAGVIYGTVLAVAQQDYRRMLAYSSIVHISYIGMAIGMANAIGLVGGLLHILNHALMKGCLFLIGGGIRYRTGGSQLSHLMGLGRTMPWTMAAFTICALAMVGIPPTAGFYSKWYLLRGALEAGNLWWFAVIIFSSLVSAVYFFRVVELIYGPPPDSTARSVTSGTVALSRATPDGSAISADHELPATMLGPILVLAVSIIVVGLMNVLIVNHVLMRVAAPLGG